MMRFRFREVRPVRFRFIGPSDMAPALRLPGVGVVAAIIGPPGSDGQDGEDGAAEIPDVLDGGNF